MTITDQTLSAYRKTLIAAERATATIEKYMSNLTSFATWLGNRPLEKEYISLNLTRNRAVSPQIPYCSYAQ